MLRVTSWLRQARGRCRASARRLSSSCSTGMLACWHSAAASSARALPGRGGPPSVLLQHREPGWMAYRVGVDIGGTFADFCVLDERTGALSTLKVLSTPATPGAEVIAGLEGIQHRFRITP